MSQRKRKLMGDINVVPYIDVMLVLLVIFMVTAPLLTQGITVELPKAAADPLDPDLTRENEPLVLSIDRSGLLYLNIGDDEEAPIDEGTVVARTAAGWGMARRVTFPRADLPALLSRPGTGPGGRPVAA